jgi:UPF0271 protein
LAVRPTKQADATFSGLIWMRIDLNCDMGESFGPWPMGQDELMLDLVTSANVACGFHAGDPQIMLNLATLTKAKGVALGAHPGFHDLQGFGRRRILGLTARELEATIAYQVGALQAVAALAGYRVTHVKPHGALSNMACESEDIAAAIGAGIKAVDPTLVFVILPLTALEVAGRKTGLTLASEVFADRAYEDDGSLVSRSKPDAVLHDPAVVAARVLQMVEEQAVMSQAGRKLPISVDTICVHGDTPNAVSLARAVRGALEANGIEVRPFA